MVVSRLHSKTLHYNLLKGGTSYKLGQVMAAAKDEHLISL